MASNIIRALCISTALLIVPIIASFFLDGWLWTGFDYFFAWVMFSIASLAFTFIATSDRRMTYKLAVGITVVASFLLIWVNGAVGMIGDEGNPANLMYLGVVALALLGMAAARLRPLPMSYAMYVAASAQFIVPVIAMIVWRPAMNEAPGMIGIFALNTLFVAMFAASALLFRRASDESAGTLTSRA